MHDNIAYTVITALNIYNACNNNEQCILRTVIYNDTPL